MSHMSDLETNSGTSYYIRRVDIKLATYCVNTYHLTTGTSTGYQIWCVTSVLSS